MIRTERLLLRRWTDADRALFAAMNADPIVMQHLQELMSPEASDAFVVSFTVPQNIRSRRVMERIGLVRDSAGDFEHPRVDLIAYPHLVPHVFYRLSRVDWQAR